MTSCVKLLLKVLGIAVFSCAHTTFAQSLSPEEVFENYFEDWFQIEVIVFERIQESSNDPEIWPTNITLSYPARYDFLVSEESEENSTIDLNEPASDNSDLLEQLQKTTTEDPATRKIRDSIEKSELERLTPKEQPFAVLDEELRALTKERRLLGRDRAMRILFHESWRQRIDNEKDARSIIIAGGEDFDGKNELEGSIKFHLSRYLHVHTNIWLTQFEANVGQETQPWPLIPERPVPVILEETLDENPEFSFEQEEPADTNDLNLQFTFNDSNANYSFGSDENDDLNNFSTFNQSPFVVNHVVTMKQRRRMRSGELHYLDHPKLGILVRIDRYKPEFTEPSES